MTDETKDPASKSQGKNVIPILSSPDIQKGVYSNVALIHHTENEFILDFLMQVGGEAQLVSRVILSPPHCRLLKKALEDNLDKYEQQFGEKRTKKP
jgi:hypothetical protein